MSEQPKSSIDSTAEEIGNSRTEREERFERYERERQAERRRNREERLESLAQKASTIKDISHVASLAAVAFGLFAVTKRLDAVEALMTGLRQNGVQVTVTTARHLAEKADEIAGMAG